jgi:Protein of unknown function (DUF3237)
VARVFLRSQARAASGGVGSPATGWSSGTKLSSGFAGLRLLGGCPRPRRCLDVGTPGPIFVQYQGRADLSRGLQLPLTVYVAPRFETGDERYAWLNRIQAVGKGSASALSRARTSGIVAPGAVRAIVHLATHSSISSWKVNMKWWRPVPG